MVQSSNEVIKRWLSVFNKCSYNNEMLGILSFHLIFGQVVFPARIYKQGIREDPRVNMFYMQDSGSGKTTALDLCVYVEKKLGFNVIDNISKLSDAYLVGSYTEGKNKKDIKKLHGKLKDIDILHVDEGEILFKGGDYNKNLVNILNAAANTYLSAGNKVVVGYKGSLMGGEISFYPHCSVGITTYEPEAISKGLLRKGLFQRYFFYPRQLTIEDRILNSRIDAQNVGKKFDYRRAVEPVISELLEIKDYVDSHGEIDISFDKVRPLLTQCIDILYNKIKHIPPEIGRVLGEFISRYNTKYYVLCLHHALLSKRFEINKDDVYYANSILMDMFEKQLNFIEGKHSTYKEISRRYVDFSVLVKAFERTKIKDARTARAMGVQIGYAPKTELLRTYAELLGVSAATARKKYIELCKTKRFSDAIVEESGFKFNRRFVKIYTLNGGGA